MKVLTVVGTRPEIIRLAAVMRRLDATPGIEHVLVHTGQNWDHQLNGVFFEEMGLRLPDHVLDVDVSSLGATLGDTLRRTEAVLGLERPDAFLVLGDTNSALSLIMAKRMQIPTYHMEAGNRCFDGNVPEETNRRLVDHTADFNLAYTEHARRNLLAEGLHPRRVLVTGSPMNEVLGLYREAISASKALDSLGVTQGELFLVSAHREENVDQSERLELLIRALNAVAEEWGWPVLVSTHPRTRERLEAGGGGGAGSANGAGSGPLAAHRLVRLLFPVRVPGLQPATALFNVRAVGQRHRQRGVHDAGLPRCYSALLNRTPRGPGHRIYHDDRSRPEGRGCRGPVRDCPHGLTGDADRLRRDQHERARGQLHPLHIRPAPVLGWSAVVALSGWTQ